MSYKLKELLKCNEFVVKHMIIYSSFILGIVLLIINLLKKDLKKNLAINQT